ncbi:hypothetical protein [Streptomyces sp. NPDC093598]|uniref:hypothetical protein n=1 Tax=Streptomyces sp. NPDC093598 TaxID=3366046 RepID=UPI00380E2210
MAGLRAKPLEAATWPDFALLVERHKGVWGGCWRITCFFVDRAHRRRGVAAAALEGALYEIARLGGGSVEGCPEDTGDRSVSASFLYSGTMTLFESQGFERIRRLGKRHWVVSRNVAREAVRAGRTGGS